MSSFVHYSLCTYVKDIILIYNHVMLCYHFITYGYSFLCRPCNSYQYYQIIFHLAIVVLIKIIILTDICAGRKVEHYVRTSSYVSFHLSDVLTTLQSCFSWGFLWLKSFCSSAYLGSTLLRHIYYLHFQILPFIV